MVLECAQIIKLMKEMSRFMYFDKFCFLRFNIVIVNIFSGEVKCFGE